MAKLERHITGNFEEVLHYCCAAVEGGSLTASYEDGSDFLAGDTRVAVRVFERYSAFGSNRVSLSLTLVGVGSNIFLSAITAGGSQAMLFKINTVGEEFFLDTLRAALDKRYP